MTTDTEFAEAVSDDIFDEQIFVFTPSGEVKDLPVGSTPLDFAYRIHSKIGDRCAGARVTSQNGNSPTDRMWQVNGDEPKFCITSCQPNWQK